MNGLPTTMPSDQACHFFLQAIEVYLKLYIISIQYTCRHDTHLSSLFKQWTSLGRMPDLIRSSIGGLRSLDNNFLQTQSLKQHINTHCQHGNVNFMLFFPNKLNICGCQFKWMESPACWQSYSGCKANPNTCLMTLASLLVHDKVNRKKSVFKTGGKMCCKSLLLLLEAQQ